MIADELEFKLEMNAIYHQRKAFYLKRWHMAMNFIVMLCGAGVVSKASQGSEALAVCLGLAVAIFSSLQLLFDFTKAVSLHHELYQKYKRLQVDFVKDGSDANCARIEAEIHLIELDEPAHWPVLLEMCYEQVAVSTGREFKHPKPRRFFFLRQFAVFGI